MSWPNQYPMYHFHTYQPTTFLYWPEPRTCQECVIKDSEIAYLTRNRNELHRQIVAQQALVLLRTKRNIQRQADLDDLRLEIIEMRAERLTHLEKEAGLG